MSAGSAKREPTMQAYSCKARENDPHALPNIEVFYFADECPHGDQDCACMEPGWYWWVCFPGCLPDSEPEGPFDSEAAAMAAAREAAEAQESYEQEIREELAHDEAMRIMARGTP